MAGLFKPPCASHVERLTLEGDSGQHPVKRTLAVGGDKHHAIVQIVSIPRFSYEFLTMRKVRINEAVSERISYSIRVAIRGVNGVLHLPVSPRGKNLDETTGVRAGPIRGGNVEGKGGVTRHKGDGEQHSK